MSSGRRGDEPGSGPMSTLTIRGQEIPVETCLIEHTKLRYFPDNPRIYSIVRADGKEPTQEEIQEQLLQREHVRDLVLDIRQNGGLTDPLVSPPKRRTDGPACRRWGVVPGCGGE